MPRRGFTEYEVHNVAERMDLPRDDDYRSGRISEEVPAHVRVSAWVGGQVLLWTIAGAVCYAALAG